MASNPYDVINTPASSSAANTAAQSPLGGSSAEDIQSTFLKLFMAQLQAQDPLNPMDNSQLTSQMAQISQVSGIQQLNQSMMSLVGAQAASQSLMAAGMIGKNVMVEGKDLTLANEGSNSQGGVLLDGPAQSLTVSVKDANGNVVKNITIPQPVAGVNTFQWDGTDNDGNQLPPGQYSFSADVAQASSGGTTKATPYNAKTVNAVAWDKGVPELVLADGSRVGLGDVAQMTA
ncbi:flagellar hook assembly protein FlgD [Neisseriaceae bacterium TC5R-5]|nr:flagellar hook assembly protein FlgD [Neisseriaceae bacterium TC5R-5]